MTPGEIGQGCGMPLERLYKDAGSPAKVHAAARLNMAAKTYNVKFEPDKVRDFVRNYLEGKPASPVPVVPSNPAGAQPPAGSAASGRCAAKGESKGQGPGQGQDHPGGSDREVTGFMTPNEIALKTGVPKEGLLKSLGIAASIDPRSPVREWIDGQGKSIQDLRDAVQDYRAGKR
jgi:hypothetical protein